MPKISPLVVMDTMASRNLDIRLSPINNIISARKIRRGTKVTIGVEGDVVAAIANGRFVGGLILADRDQYKTVEQELSNKEEKTDA